MELKVVKVGGSLFEWPNFKSQLQLWMDAQSNVPTVFVAGGGKFVDQVRKWQLQFGWSDQHAHVQALARLRTTSRLMNLWFPGMRITDNYAELASSRGDHVIFDCSNWAKRLPDIPQNWKLTSDSLSAILANELSASELILLKSRSMNSNDPLEDAEIVDPLFLFYARTPVRIINLRAASFYSCAIRPRSR